jgi:hypothetical protein
MAKLTHRNREADPLAHHTLRVGGPDGVVRGGQGIASENAALKRLKRVAVEEQDHRANGAEDSRHESCQLCVGHSNNPFGLPPS